MIRPSRLILAAALVIAAGCAEGMATGPERLSNSLVPDPSPTFAESDTTCRGWENPNGKKC
jgi:hypothetical protein